MRRVTRFKKHFITQLERIMNQTNSESPYLVETSKNSGYISQDGTIKFANRGNARQRPMGRVFEAYERQPARIIG
jgi:hypothetical protein